MEFKQASDQYNAMTAKEKEMFVANIVESLMFVEEETQQIILQRFFRVDENLGKILEKRLHF